MLSQVSHYVAVSFRTVCDFLAFIGGCCVAAGSYCLIAVSYCVAHFFLTTQLLEADVHGNHIAVSSGECYEDNRIEQEPSIEDDPIIKTYSHAYQLLEEMHDALLAIGEDLEEQLAGSKGNSIGLIYDFSTITEDNRVFMQDMKEIYLGAMNQPSILKAHCRDKLQSIKNKEQEVRQSVLSWKEQYKIFFGEHAIDLEKLDAFLDQPKIGNHIARTFALE